MDDPPFIHNRVMVNSFGSIILTKKDSRWIKMIKDKVYMVGIDTDDKHLLMVTA